MDHCLQAFFLGSGDLHMFVSETDKDIAQILVFLDNLLMFYQAFGVNLIRLFIAGGACTSIQDCASTRAYISFRRPHLFTGSSARA